MHTNTAQKGKRNFFSIDPDTALPQVENMIYSLAWKTAQLYPIRFEETKTEAYWAFMKACRTYNPESKGKFTSWCYFIICCRLKSLVMDRTLDSAVLSFVEVLDDETFGEAPEEVSEALELVRDLPEDARTLFGLLCEAPQEILEGFRLLLHGETDNDTNVQKAIRFLKKRGKSVFDLQGLHGQLALAAPELVR